MEPFAGFVRKKKKKNYTDLGGGSTIGYIIILPFYSPFVDRWNGKKNRRAKEREREIDRNRVRENEKEIKINTAKSSEPKDTVQCRRRDKLTVEVLPWKPPRLWRQILKAARIRYLSPCENLHTIRIKFTILYSRMLDFYIFSGYFIQNRLSFCHYRDPRFKLSKKKKKTSNIPPKRMPFDRIMLLKKKKKKEGIWNIHYS